MENQNQIIPPPQRGRHSIYNFGLLKTTGESVFIPTERPQNVRDAAHKFAKYNGFKIATRVEGNGLRIYYVGAANEKSEN